jgi:hypothetical protein
VVTVCSKADEPPPALLAGADVWLGATDVDTEGVTLGWLEAVALAWAEGVGCAEAVALVWAGEGVAVGAALEVDLAVDVDTLVEVVVVVVDVEVDPKQMNRKHQRLSRWLSSTASTAWPRARASEKAFACADTRPARTRMKWNRNNRMAETDVVS